MSQPTDLKSRLERLSPEQRARLSQRLAAGREVAPAAGYLAMGPTAPVRLDEVPQPGQPPCQIAVYPASHSQQRMWFLHEYAGRVPVYVMLSSFHLRGPLDEEVLFAAVGDVVRRHATLRTTFVMDGGQLFQHVLPESKFAWEAKTFEAVHDTERTAVVDDFLQEMGSRKFDLAMAPGFRVALARMGPEEHVLCFVTHHIISDGWSRSNLWREVGACYTSRAGGEQRPLPPLPVQFVDYAAWQERQLSGGMFSKQAAYWRAQLAGALEPLDLPADRHRPKTESFRGAQATISLDPSLTAKLTKVAREEGATFFMVLLAAFKTLLHRYTGREDLLVGVPIANRQRLEVEGLIGFFVNTLVMRTNLGGDPTFRELLGRVKETAIQAYANQDMPFERLVEMLQLPRHAGVTPVFQVSFAFQDFPAVNLELPGVQTSPWQTETHTAKFDLSMLVQNTRAGWMATAEYSTDLFDADRMKRMLQDWVIVLESIAGDPGLGLPKIPVFPAGAGQQLLRESNRTEGDSPRHVHFLFPGHGSERMNMTRSLYENLTIYRERVDSCLELASTSLKLPLRDMIFPEPDNREFAREKLRDTAVIQPALFTIQYSLGRALMDLGIEPSGMLGHSVGEYVAACLAGVFSFKTALEIVIKRGQLVQGVPRGSMLAVALPGEEVSQYLSDRISMASTNGPRQCVLSGFPDAIDDLKERLKKAGVATKRVDVNRAFHSVMLDPVLEPFGEYLGSKTLALPTKRFVSCLHGRWADPAEVCQPEYWVRQLREPVRFFEGLGELAGPDSVFLEVGASGSLLQLVKASPGYLASNPCLATCPAPHSQTTELDCFLDSLRQLESLGVAVHRDLLPECHRPGTSGADARKTGAEVRAEPGSPDKDPLSETESVVAMWFSRMLGLPEVDTDVNFLEAGGNSLMAMQVISRINDHCRVAVSIRKFFDDPTVRGVAKLVSTLLLEGPATIHQAPGKSNDMEPAPCVDDLNQQTPPGVEVLPDESPVQEKRSMDLSLFFFAGDEGANPDDRYQLVMDAARLADEAGFAAIWLPERHFNKFGGLYPNPAVLGAAIAAVTRRIHIRGGSVVAPLHHPVRIAEEWSVVDNLSKGRIGIAFGSGFHPNDFLLAPEAFNDRKERMFRSIAAIRHLWRGGRFRGRSGTGDEIETEIFPKPYSEKLPVWLATSRSKETFAEAGKIGANVLTALLRLSVQELEERIAVYRSALQEAGHDPSTGKVTVMVHTFLASTYDEARSIVEKPLKAYLRSHMEHTRVVSLEKAGNAEDARLSSEEEEALIDYAFDRYLKTSSLIGNADSAIDMVRQLEQIGVHEIACLVDFGVDHTSVLSSLRHLEELHERVTQATRPGKEHSLEQQEDPAVPGEADHLRPMPESERQRVLVEWNNTGRDYPRDKTLHQLFEEQAERTPGTVAVVVDDQSLTYRELNERADQLAVYLQSLGVGPEVLVGLCLERSPEMVVGMLGILKAGGAYLPLDPEYPADRVAFMIEDSGVPVIVTRESTVSLLPKTTARLVRLDTDWPLIVAGRSGQLTRGVQPHHLAYMIYTSGTTGRPKGVLIPHQAVVNHMCWMRDVFPMEADDRVFQKTPFSFDASVWEFYAPLLAGARLVMAAPGGHADLGYLIKTIVAERITHFQAVPSLLRVLTQTPGFENCQSLRHVFSGGETLSADLAREILGTIGAELHNLYGPTEATIDSTYYSLPKKEIGGTVVPIGRPITNLRAYILDQRLEPVPVGVAGELYLGGIGLARGYHNLPELTSEKFLPDPFCQMPGERIYKTGDCARHLPDGNIECLGRFDHQVKIRGHRIELEEVEAILNTHPDVVEAAALARNEAIGGLALVAFVVAREASHPTIAGLRLFLHEKLPDPMVPSRFVMVPALPLTSSGKVDRKALEKLEGHQLPAGSDYLAPRTELEHELVKIWQDVLRRDHVGLGDHFFEVGGHSLLAVALCSQIAQRLSLEVPLRWVFENPTLELQARRLEGLKNHSLPASPIPRADRQQPLPMSFAQQGMWLLQQASVNPATYNMSVAWHVEGPVDKARVIRALEMIQSRHDVLRSALVDEEGSLVQKIREDLPLPWEEVNLREFAKDERDLEERLLTQARRPFDMDQPPLWRVLWIAVGNDESLLAFTFHHSIMDEWSIRLFFEELTLLYEAKGGEACLPDLPIQYADYAMWQRERLRGDEASASSNYWREQLRDLPPNLNLPADMPKPPTRSGRGGRQTFHLDHQVTAKLVAISRQENTTPFLTALAACHVWLYRYTGQSDLVVATPISGRDRQELQNLLGCFLNTLPIRCRVEGGQGFREILRQLRQTVMDAFDHSLLPFETMVELAVTERTAHSQPLHQVMFVFLEGEVPHLGLGGSRSQRVPMRTNASKCDLTFSVLASKHGWDCELEYASDQFSTECASRMVTHLKELLEAIAEAPEDPVDILRLMPEPEQQRVLVEWNQTGRDYPRDKTIHQLFEEQVKQTPHGVALQSGEECLTYEQLNSRANIVAHHLRSLGVGRDVLVGLVMERSMEAVVALLGILKAGGAYVPLDPDLPPARLGLLLSDIDAPWVLCQNSKQNHLLSMIQEPGSRRQILVLEDICLNEADNSNPSCNNTSSDLAYVMYTSGTTGKPKGVMVPHRGIVRLVVRPDYVALGADEVILQYAPLSFDASTFEIWGGLLNGAKLIVPPGTSFDLNELGTVISQYQITTLWLTASLFHQMMELQPLSLAGVRQLLSGGDVLSPSRVREYLEMPGHGRLINGYGPTENTTFTCCGVFDRADQIGDSVPIGRPIAGTCVYILNKSGEPAPVGVVGELYAGGDGLARGYLNAPELTEERFVRDPFSGNIDAKLYKTGDLARWRSDGTIEFVGRADQQVKIRGYRLEMGEIEHALRVCHGISDAVVVAKENPAGDKQLLAYLVPSFGDKPEVAPLRSELAEMLPEYSIPNTFVVLDHLPLGSNGKVDRMTLAQSTGVELAFGGEDAPARTELERRLVGIWQEILNKERVGIHDDFFALGGHSLQAARLVAEIEKLVGHRLSIAALFQSPTIASLVRRLADEQWAPAWSSLVPLQPLGSQPPLFLLHGWGGDVYGFLGLAKHLAPDQPVYGVQAVGLDENGSKHASVEQMAAHYTAEIQSLQPEGPYHLCGYSLGGLIAYETAQQLHNQGQRVAVLALLDSTPVGPIPPALRALLLALLVPERLVFHLRQFWRLPANQRIPYLQGRWRALQNQMLKNRGPLPAEHLPDPAAGATQEPSQSSDYFLEVTKAYHPSRYSGPLDVFVSEESSFSTRFYWQFLARGRAVFHRIPGRHREILSAENLPELAKAFARTIRQAGQKPDPQKCQQSRHASHPS
ncbi:MAG: amino acid adenylation domain-containing protein [Terrimicrobiaceae bacterium]